MVPVPDNFWAEIDQRIAGSRQSIKHRDAEVIPLEAATTAGKQAAAHVPAAASAYASDWSRVLDTLTAAKDFSQSQEARLLTQASIHEALITELRAEIQRLQEEVCASKAEVCSVRAAAEATTQEIVQQAEARIEENRILAETQVRVAEERAQVAETRADDAEAWLTRIACAAQDLAPLTETQQSVAA